MPVVVKGIVHCWLCKIDRESEEVNIGEEMNIGDEVNIG